MSLQTILISAIFITGREIKDLRGISCIPEGRYELKKRYTAERGWHLILANVPDRQLILIHAANDANKELHSYIAPVSILTAEGKASQSRSALAKINAIVFPVLDEKKSRDPQSSSGSICLLNTEVSEA